MSSKQEDPSKPLRGSQIPLMRLACRVTNISEAHGKGRLEPKKIQTHTITSGERLFNSSASTDYHVDAFVDHGQRSEGLAQGSQDLEEQAQRIYVRNTIDVGRT